MPQTVEFILGEFPRTIDERFRVAIPGELAAGLTVDGPQCVLAKERPGCLSLWNAKAWKTRFDSGVELVKGKMRAGKLEGRLEQVQLLGRLLSTRHKIVELGDRGRLLIPDGFREFLNAEPGTDVLIVGAAVCIEIWKPDAWRTHLESHMTEFTKLFDELSG